MKLIPDSNGCSQSDDGNQSTGNGSDQMEACQSGIHGQLINDTTADIFVVIFQVALTGIFAVGGIITNSINIVVFKKMGLNDAVNISLFGLAISDFLSLTFSLWESICFNPLVHDTDAPVVFTEIEYITGCWPHVCLVRVASYITAFITLERCLCIAVPLKVKRIITTRRTKGVIIGIYLVVIFTTIPEYYVSQLRWKFYPEKNRTMLGIYFIEDREKFESVTLILNNVILQFVAFISVVVCTIILTIQLNRKAKWRQETVRGEKSTAGKDKRVIKMISLISLIFIISDLPSCLNVVAMACTPSLHPSGVNYNMFYVIWSIVYVMEGVNSSVNIFVYMNMSSKYKQVFNNIFSNNQDHPTISKKHRPVSEVTLQSEVSSH